MTSCTGLRAIMIVAVVGAAVSCASSEPTSDLSIDIDSDEIRVAISETVARSVMENLLGADLECAGDIDGDFKTLLEKLDRNGPRSRATYRDGENTINARRRGKKLDLYIAGQGSGKIEATLPWAVAECLLGTTTTIDETITSSVKVKVTNSEGRNFSFKMD